MTKSYVTVWGLDISSDTCSAADQQGQSSLLCQMIEVGVREHECIAASDPARLPRPSCCLLVLSNFSSMSRPCTSARSRGGVRGILDS